MQNSTDYFWSSHIFIVIKASGLCMGVNMWKPKLKQILATAIFSSNVSLYHTYIYVCVCVVCVCTYICVFVRVCIYKAISQITLLQLHTSENSWLSMAGDINNMFTTINTTAVSVKKRIYVLPIMNYGLLILKYCFIKLFNYFVYQQRFMY